MVTRMVPALAQLVSLSLLKYPRCPAAIAPMMSQMTTMTPPIDPVRIGGLLGRGDGPADTPNALISKPRLLPPAACMFAVTDRVGRRSATRRPRPAASARAAPPTA